MKKLLIQVTLIALYSVNSFSQDYPTKALRKTFNENQLRDIERIIVYMDSLVISHHPNLDKSEAYHFFLDSLRINFLEVESYNGPIAIDEEIKYNFLSSLDTNTFNEIWIDQSPRMIRTKDTVIYNPPHYHYLDINNQGQFMDYLKRLGRRSKYFKAVHESIEASGSIGPSLVAGMFYKHHYLDFEKTDDRLWAAVFYLTIEESMEKKINRYYK